MCAREKNISLFICLFSVLQIPAMKVVMDFYIWLLLW